MTIAETLREHPEIKRVLLKFHHGLGDAMMFHAGPLPALKSAFPEVQFFVHTHLGQEEVFGNVDADEAKYDAVYDIVFPCAEWDTGDESKPEKCTRVELGVDVKAEDYASLNHCFNPLVGVHFHSTCIKWLCTPYGFANRLWLQLEDEGMVPIDTHMRHAHDNAGTLPAWADRNVQGLKATVPKLMGLMKALGGFIGSVSGNFFTALSALPPDRIMFIRTSFDARKLTKLPVWQIDAGKDYDTVKVHEFIQHLKGKA